MSRYRILLPLFLVVGAVALNAQFRASFASERDCQLRLKKLGQLGEIYASDNLGLYPRSFLQYGGAQSCPVTAAKYRYQVDSKARYFTISCNGQHGVSKDYPCVVNERGVYPLPFNPAEGL